MIKDDRRVRIFTGHYGSGKTEVAVNYAAVLSGICSRTAIADIDVINPYFRSRERVSELEALGIRVISSSVNAPAVDVPALPAEVFALFDTDEWASVVDAGGGKAGADVLNRFSDHFYKPEDYDLFLVINAYRPDTSNEHRIADLASQIESACGLRVTGLINNTNNLKSTTAEDLVYGYNLVDRVAEITGIPLRYSTGIRALEITLPEEVRRSFLPLDLYMRDEWMS